MKHDSPRVFVPPPLIVLACMVLGRLGSRWLDPPVMWGPGIRVAGSGLVLGGVAIAAWALVDFARWKTKPEPWNPTTHLITTGPFRYSRNPIYLAFLVVQIGVGLALADVLVVGSVIPSALLLRYAVIRREERYLWRTFPAEYAEYTHRVGRWW